MTPDVANQQSPNAPAGSAIGRGSWLVASLLLLLAAGAIFYPALNNEFDNDDAWNALLQAHWALTGKGSVWSPGGSFLWHENVQRLAGVLTFLARYLVFESDVRGWHGFAILTHAGNALFLAATVHSGMTGVASLGSRAVALATSMVFLASPLVIQPVTWIGGTYDLLATLGFGMLAFGVRSRRLWLEVAGALLALTSKETGAFAVVIALGFGLISDDGRVWKARLLGRWPVLVATLVVIGFRLAQIASVDGVAAAGLPGRELGVSPNAILVEAPLGVLAALGFPFREALGSSSGALVVSGAALLGVALFVAWPTRRVLVLVGVALASGWVANLPAAMMVDSGQRTDLDLLVFNSRYLYTASWFGFVAVGVLLVEASRASLARMSLAGVAVGAGLIASVPATTAEVSGVSAGSEVLAQVRPAALLFGKGPAEKRPGTPVTVVMSELDERTYLFVMSRWLGEITGRPFRIAWRGSWAVDARKQLNFGVLDRERSHVERLPRPFNPSQLGPDEPVLWIEMDGAPRVEWRQLERDGPILLGQGHALPSNWRPVDAHGPCVLSGPKASVTIGGCPSEETSRDPSSGSEEEAGSERGEDRQSTGGASTSGAGRHQRVMPSVVLTGLTLHTSEVVGLRLTYQLIPEEGAPDEATFRGPMLELTWSSTLDPSSAADFNGVALPVIADGHPHALELPLWFDPGWREVPVVRSIGLQLRDLRANLTLSGVEAIRR